MKLINDLVYFDVGVHILTADEGIEENVGQHGDNKPIAEDGASRLGHSLLNKRHDTTANHHCHEDARCCLCIFAETLNREVEDSSPHDRGAKSASRNQECLGRNVMAAETDGDTLGHEDCNKQQDDSHSTNRRQLELG